MDKHSVSYAGAKREPGDKLFHIFLVRKEFETDALVAVRYAKSEEKAVAEYKEENKDRLVPGISYKAVKA